DRVHRRVAGLRPGAAGVVGYRFAGEADGDEVVRSAANGNDGGVEAGRGEGRRDPGRSPVLGANAVQNGKLRGLGVTASRTARARNLPSTGSPRTRPSRSSQKATAS